MLTCYSSSWIVKFVRYSTLIATTVTDVCWCVTNLWHASQGRVNILLLKEEKYQDTNTSYVTQIERYQLSKDISATPL